MDTIQGIDSLAEVLATAKPRALGAGAIIDREQAMQLIEEIRASLPMEIINAQELLGSVHDIQRTARADAEMHVTQAKASAEEHVAQATARAEELVSEHSVTQDAVAQAQQIVALAEAEAARKRAEIDAYVESKLANFEGILAQTMDAVSNGRRKMAGDSGEIRDSAELPT